LVAGERALPRPLESPREGREERRIEGGIEVVEVGTSFRPPGGLKLVPTSKIFER